MEKTVTPDQTAWNRLLDFADARFPGLKIKYKDEVWHQRLIMKLVPTYRNFTTALAGVIYFPNREQVEGDPGRYLSTLAHELVHLEDRRRWGNRLFELMYMFPQSLALFALFALLGPIFPKMYWALVTLAFIAPIPAPFRMWFELKGYTMSMAMLHRRSGTIPEARKEHIVGHFLKPTYWFMWPFKGMIRRRVDVAAGDIMSGRYVKENEFARLLFEALDD